MAKKIDWHKRLEKAEEKYNLTVDEIFPIGSIYRASDENINPNKLFRKTLWDRYADSDNAWIRVK